MTTPRDCAGSLQIIKDLFASIFISFSSFLSTMSARNVLLAHAPRGKHANWESDNAATACALVELFPDIAQRIPYVLEKCPFTLCIAFQDYSNLGTPGRRHLAMILTISGAPGAYLVQVVYRAKRMPGRADTLRTHFHVHIAEANYKFTARAKSSSAKAPAPLLPNFGTLKLPRNLEPLLPVLHQLACTPFHQLAPLFAGTLQASLRTSCPSLFAASPK